MNQASQMPSDLKAVNVNGQSNIDVVQTKNLGTVPGNLNHLEKLSQYTAPGVAVSIAQQEALYREYLHAQIQQYGNDQGVGHANSQSGSGVENPGNQSQTSLQSVKPPPLLPPMQSPRPPNPVLAPSNSIFVPDFSTNLQVN